MRCWFEHVKICHSALSICRRQGFGKPSALIHQSNTKILNEAVQNETFSAVGL